MLETILIGILSGAVGYLIRKPKHICKECQFCADAKTPITKGIEAIKDIINEIKPKSHLKVIESNREQIRVKREQAEGIINPEDIPKNYEE